MPVSPVPADSLAGQSTDLVPADLNGADLNGADLNGADPNGTSLTAEAVARGICRLFARNDIWCLREMPLRSSRRADLMGIDAKGQLVIVEIKVSRADLIGDSKWTDYLAHCDRFYWGLAAHLDPACLQTEAFQPGRCGLIVADGYDAEIIRPAPTVPLAAARRKTETERLARAALRRHTGLIDPRPGTLSF